jgi:hypothetical protein
MTNQLLEKLWSIAEIEAKRIGSDLSFVFNPIGLILRRPIERESYETTPDNSLAFATTGGDGVHYSLMHVEGEAGDLSPVVMTVPMNFEQENLIVGSDMKEFLCLGCQVGYFFLEQLTYHESETIYWLTNPGEWFEELNRDSETEDDVNRKKYLLNLLSKELNLKPWEEFEQRLNYLRSQYYSLLEFSSGDIGTV